MIIPHDLNGWSYDNSTGNWKLVYSDKLIVIYDQIDESIATQSVLFVGTKDECDKQILDLGLHFPDESDELPEELVTEEIE